MTQRILLWYSLPIFMLALGSLAFATAADLKPRIVKGRVFVPAGASSCRVTLVGEPSVTCEKGSPAFKRVRIVRLPEGEFARCEISAPAKGNKPVFGCVGIPPIVIRPSVVIGDTVTLPEVAGACTVTDLAGGQLPVLECEPPASGGITFAPNQTVTLPVGSASSCDIAADPEGKPLIACSGIPLFAIPPIAITGDTVTLPEEATTCNFTAPAADTPPVLECDPPTPGSGDPTFAPNQTVTIPVGTVSKCDIAADPEGKPAIGCVGFPLFVIPPIAITGDTVTLPEEAASCSFTAPAADAQPVLECEPPTPGSGEPTFAPNQTVTLPVGTASGCDIAADPEGKPLIGCSGIPL